MGIPHGRSRGPGTYPIPQRMIAWGEQRSSWDGSVDIRQNRCLAYSRRCLIHVRGRHWRRNTRGGKRNIILVRLPYRVPIDFVILVARGTRVERLYTRNNRKSIAYNWYLRSSGRWRALITWNGSLWVSQDDKPHTRPKGI